MQNSKYAPLSRNEYSKNDLNANFKGCKFTATKNSTTSYDMLISDDHLADGASVFVLNAAIGDKLTLQVIDIDNVLGYGANVVLGQYVTDWYINPSASSQGEFTSMYPAKILAGLYLRKIYTSVGTETDPTVVINYKLHKVLW